MAKGCERADRNWREGLRLSFKKFGYRRISDLFVPPNTFSTCCPVGFCSAEPGRRCSLFEGSRAECFPDRFVSHLICEDCPGRRSFRSASALNRDAGFHQGCESELEWDRQVLAVGDAPAGADVPADEGVLDLEVVAVAERKRRHPKRHTLLRTAHSNQ